jgi:hypothetical protein
VLSRASVSLTPGGAVTPGGIGVAALLQQSTLPPPAPVSAPPEPSFSAHNRLALPQGYSGIQSTGPPPAKQDTLAGQLQKIERLSGSVVPRAKVNVSGRNVVAPGRSLGGGRIQLHGRGGAAAGSKGPIAVAPSANRAGAPLRGVTRRFVSHVAAIAGTKITITTGTNHSRMTVDGNVSDHWDGHAADIAVPIDSRRGDRIATAALVAAGVSKHRARQMARRGGLYTLNYKGRRIQVIWKTYAGGNHHNHVHIGIR